MKVGIMQPYFFPYLGYWQLMNLVDEYVIFDDVNYIKRGWINRNNILYNGAPKRINLHIKDASQNRLINNTYIAETQKDVDNLLEVIKQAYKKAPYFRDVYGLIEEILRYPETNLAYYLQNQIIRISEYLGIETKIILSSKIEKNNQLKNEEKILDICKARNADCYINAIGGKELYHHDKFKENGIELNFLKTNCVEYKQFGSEFVSNLSIIDVMMFNNKKEIGQLLTAFGLEN